MSKREPKLVRTQLMTDGACRSLLDSVIYSSRKKSKKSDVQDLWMGVVINGFADDKVSLEDIQSVISVKKIIDSLAMFSGVIEDDKIDSDTKSKVYPLVFQTAMKSIKDKIGLNMLMASDDCTGETVIDGVDYTILIRYIEYIILYTMVYRVPMTAFGLIWKLENFAVIYNECNEEQFKSQYFEFTEKAGITFQNISKLNTICKSSSQITSLDDEIFDEFMTAYFNNEDGLDEIFYGLMEVAEADREDEETELVQIPENVFKVMNDKDAKLFYSKQTRRKFARRCLLGLLHHGKTGVIVSGEDGEAMDEVAFQAGALAKVDYRAEVFMLNASPWMNQTHLDRALQVVREHAEESKNMTVLIVDRIKLYYNGHELLKQMQLIMKLLSVADADVRVIFVMNKKEARVVSDLVSNLGIINVPLEPMTHEEAELSLRESLGNYADKIPSGLLSEVVRLADMYDKSLKLPDSAYRLFKMAVSIAFDNGLDSEEEFSVTNLSMNDLQDAVKVITGKTVGQASELETLRALDGVIKEKLIGQDEAVDKVVKAVKRGKLGISEENKPLASFLFTGPTGVGKTELCKLLNEAIYPNKKLIRFDMSEYTTEVDSNKFIGSAPGYVGYDNGGVLTEAIKNNPESVVLFDEIEKANPKIFDTLLQVLDAARLTDNHGDTVDFSRTIIVMTSNVGYDAESYRKPLGFNSTSALDAESTGTKALEKLFRPEFINRIDNIVEFKALSEKDCNMIVSLELGKLHDRLNNRGINFDWDENLVEFIREVGFNKKYGARNIKRAVQSNVEDYIADLMIDGSVSDGTSFKLGYNGEKRSMYHEILS